MQSFEAVSVSIKVIFEGLFLIIKLPLTVDKLYFVLKLRSVHTLSDV